MVVALIVGRKKGGAEIITPDAGLGTSVLYQSHMV
jgi:hypothetical protein